jgi:hypothetical protein
MKRGVQLLYDFIEQKVEDEILENRFDQYKQLLKKPIGFLDEDYIKGRDERLYQSIKRQRRNQRQTLEEKRKRLIPKPLRIPQGIDFKKLSETTRSSRREYMMRQKERARLMTIKAELKKKGVINFEDYFSEKELGIMNTELDGYNMKL